MFLPMGLGSRFFFGLFETSCYAGREFFPFILSFIILILLVIFVDRRIWYFNCVLGMQTALHGVTSFFFVFLGTFSLMFFERTLLIVACVLLAY